MMSSVRARAAEPTIGWMLGTSAWMLTTLVPGSWTSWLGFVIIGFAGRMPRWVVTGVVLGIAAIVAATPIWGQFSPVAVAVVYIVGMLLALVANPQWLRTRWLARGAAPAEPTTRTPAAGSRAAARARDAGRSAPTTPTRKSRRSAASAPATSARRAKTDAEELAASAGASTGAFFAEPATPTDPVDVNTADMATLSALPGMTKSKAKQAMRHRDKQGGFATLDAFAASVGLQPHEIVRLRERAMCSPPPRGPRSFGRRVDY